MPRKIAALFAGLAGVCFMSVSATSTAAASPSTLRPEANNGMTIAQVAGVMRDNGFTIVLNEDKAGEPVIFSEAIGLNFALFGYNCEGAEMACSEFLFSAYFDTDVAPSLETINAFNEKALAGRAFLDETGDPNIEHLFTVSAADDGELIERNLAIWETVLTEFAEHIGYFEAGS
ncbi:MAG: YbjN domain-containing protein [Pseudomonadota bacterium]